MADNDVLIPPADPFVLFDDWYKRAVASEPNDPNALTLATVGENGFPSARIMLLKEVDARGFVFFTNYQSRKGSQLRNHPKAALCWHWKSIRRQVRVEGETTEVSPTESDAYFATRPRGSQIGAWASRQSQPLDEREDLERRVAALTKQYEGGPVPRPPHWGGYRVIPRLIEFWHDRQFRLHDRIVYTRANTEEAWRLERLNP